jgi:hypothetical protein
MNSFSSLRCLDDTATGANDSLLLADVEGVVEVNANCCECEENGVDEALALVLVLVIVLVEPEYRRRLVTSCSW